MAAGLVNEYTFLHVTLIVDFVLNLQQPTYQQYSKSLRQFIF